MNAWDYYSLRYPEGSKIDKNGEGDNGFYFNHPDLLVRVIVALAFWDWPEE